ncbi:MAG: hypothetical protein MK108_12725 [Mariniblastus sp.]|nr:hypothetical protein [Mariniblastus sp.]
MNPGTDPFEQVMQIVTEEGQSQAIAFLVEHFRNEQRFFELFEMLKIQIRHDLDLPLWHSESQESLNENKNRLLEDRLLEACREVGSALVGQGRLQDGWMYLQPLGDRTYLKELFESVEITEDNSDVMIDICLGQGIAPELGYGLVLSDHGTCNAITVFDSQCVALPPQERSRLAEMLVQHIYDELSENVHRHIEENESSGPADGKLADWISSRDWLFSSGGHHMDVTHLASAVRIGRFAVGPAALQSCHELCLYGAQLAEDFQFESPAPFENTYLDHRIYYESLLGTNVEAGAEHFREKAFAEPIEQVGPGPIETYVDLLVRLGKNREALETTIEHLTDTEHLMGIAPQLFEMAADDQDYQRLQEHFRAEGDLMRYGLCTLQSQSSAKESSLDDQD